MHSSERAIHTSNPRGSTYRGGVDVGRLYRVLSCKARNAILVVYVVGARMAANSTRTGRSHQVDKARNERQFISNVLCTHSTVMKDVSPAGDVGVFTLSCGA